MGSPFKDIESCGTLGPHYDGLARIGICHDKEGKDSPEGFPAGDGDFPLQPGCRDPITSDLKQIEVKLIKENTEKLAFLQRVLVFDTGLLLFFIGYQLTKDISTWWRGRAETTDFGDAIRRRLKGDSNNGINGRGAEARTSTPAREGRRLTYSPIAPSPNPNQKEPRATMCFNSKDSEEQAEKALQLYKQSEKLIGEVFDPLGTEEKDRLISKVLDEWKALTEDERKGIYDKDPARNCYVRLQGKEVPLNWFLARATEARPSPPSGGGGVTGAKGNGKPPPGDPPASAGAASGSNGGKEGPADGLEGKEACKSRCVSVTGQKGTPPRTWGILDGVRGFIAAAAPFVALDVLEHEGVITPPQKDTAVMGFVGAMTMANPYTPAHLALLAAPFELGRQATSGIADATGIDGLKNGTLARTVAETLGGFGGAAAVVGATGGEEVWHRAAVALQQGIASRVGAAGEAVEGAIGSLWQSAQLATRFYADKATAGAASVAAFGRGAASAVRAFAPRFFAGESLAGAGSTMLGGILCFVPFITSGSGEEGHAMMMAGGAKPDPELAGIVRKAIAIENTGALDIDWYEAGILNSDAEEGGKDERGRLFLKHYVPFARAKLAREGDADAARRAFFERFPEMEPPVTNGSGLPVVSAQRQYY